MRQYLGSLMVLVCGLSVVSPAQAWDPFRSESRDVRRGNEHLQKGQSAEALEAYETAARKLPKDAGVQLNRGLALMATDKLDAAREAFKLATQGSASKEVRAQSYYDMGLAFMQQAEAAAKTDKLDEAQGFLRESVDAFKSSLRNGPQNRDAAWNLELAKRRLVEVDKKQQEKKKQEEEKKKQDEKQDEQKQDEEKQDEEKQDEGQKDPQSDEQKKPEDEQKQDEQKSGDKNEDKAGEDKKPEDKQQDPNKPDAADEPKNEPQKPEPQKPQQGEGQEPEPSEAMPKPMQQALDALSHGEENLEKVRARMRAARQPRRVQKDW